MGQEWGMRPRDEAEVGMGGREGLPVRPTGLQTTNAGSS